MDMGNLNPAELVAMIEQLTLGNQDALAQALSPEQLAVL
jgi:hypothetical protein